jgi:biopolymer transport protein ExbB/TolQ
MTEAINRPPYARDVLTRIAAVGALLLLLLVWQRDFIAEIYLKNQITPVGYVVNGAILLLFLAGMARLINLYVRYGWEERQIVRALSNLYERIDPLDQVAPDSIIAARQTTLRELHERRAEINQGALAASLVATEASYLTFPRFVHNVLILLGAFGTIASLLVSLLGASQMLGNTTEFGGLNMVMHGMSTALNTTLTAILCYLIFAYFYMKLLDTQSHVISRVEHITATGLLPRYQSHPEAVMRDITDLVRAATELTRNMETTQKTFNAAADRLNTVMANYLERTENAGEQLLELKALLREGFRLPPEAPPVPVAVVSAQKAEDKEADKAA